MAVLMPRIVKLSVGESAESYTDITNCKSFKWRTNHTITPQTLPSSKIPVGWLQSHIWVEGEFSLQTSDPILNTYAPSDSDAVPIPYFVLTAENTYLKEEVPFYFVGLTISSIERAIDEKGEPIFVYKFTAYYSTDELVGPK